MNRVIIRLMNALHPGYSSCMRCGRNWGWTKYVVHPTSEGSGLFLFCVDCDRVVGIQDRWYALDEWKQDAIAWLRQLDPQSPEGRDLERRMAEVEAIEFVEFPRIRGQWAFEDRLVRIPITRNG